MSVELLSGDAFTPTVCLHFVMEQVEDIEFICVSYKTKDGTVQSTLSRMPVSQAAYLAACLNRRVHNLIEESAEGGG